MAVAFATHPRLLNHLTGPDHPERPDRLRAISQALRVSRFLSKSHPLPTIDLDFEELPSGPEPLLELPLAPPAQEHWLSTCHSPEHIDRVRRQCQQGGGFLDPDTVTCPQSFDLALLALGAVFAACDAVMSGQATQAFVAIRPPGHHAESARAMGFCLFCNVGIAARYLQRQHQLGRVSIIDFDVHHGNGTQEIFEADDRVQYISIHQHPQTCYPGTGYASERGHGAGEGLTLNIPIEPGEGDERYEREFSEKVIPAIDQFAPEILLLSAGFDAHRDDPLAQMRLTERGFERITRLLTRIADVHCRGRVVSVLEGGYSLPALGRSVVHHLLGFFP